MCDISQIVDLYSALETQSAVLLLGPAGCGKTTIYSMLAKALTLLHSRTHDSIHADEELLQDKLLSSRSSKSQVFPEIIIRISSTQDN